MSCHTAGTLPIAILVLAFATASATAAPVEGAAPLAPSLDVAQCTKADASCVMSMKEIQTIRLVAERELLRVAEERATLDAYKSANNHRISSLWAQYAAGWCVLALVTGIVATGLAMAWKHMVNDFKAGTESGNSFELGRSGLKLKSPVIGLIIFVVSTYFFSVYIEKVYPITFIGSPGKLDKDTHSPSTKGKNEQP